tara:strand:+ start:1597 stop:2514 length:918 start_codon:yes stop_codon:yes gene_type:complete
MLYSGTTIAFSTKANVWKTRYSFAPTCYITMNNDFLSSNLHDENSTTMVWKHDENTTHNSFYGYYSVPSFLEVVSNQNPSSVKIFKALSIESSSLDWEGSVYTNKGRGTEALQTGSLDGFIEKEGNQYSSMPRSEINSTSNLTLAGIINKDDVEFSGSLTNDDGESYWEIPLINIPDVALPISDQSFLFFGPGLINSSENTSFSASNGFPEEGLLIIGYNEVTNSLEVRDSLGGNTSTSSTLTTALSNEGSKIPVYIMTNPAQDGDTMRGPYVGIKLTLPDSSEAFELFAINVDYEKTKLDGSLG